ncbi:MAG TPA: SURF1 family protein [Egibacteraceae bacterium]|nr:SURF1 family protein [Egibacteraceae bacterium]
MRTLLKPKWIAGHLLAVVVVVTFANLGLWQLRRHDWRAERNDRIAQGLAREPAPFASLPEGERAYRPVTVSGRYRPDADVLLTPRNELGPGHHVLTPLLLDDGTALLVDRGWVPFRHATPPVPGAAAAAGPVRLEGVLLPAAEALPQGVREGGRLVRVRAVDPDAVLDAVLGGQARAVEDVFLLLREQQPPPGPLPVPGPVPEQDAGPHLSYAIQWFLFAAVVVAGYPLLLRRAAEGV